MEEYIIQNDDSPQNIQDKKQTVKTTRTKTYKEQCRQYHYNLYCKLPHIIEQFYQEYSQPIYKLIETDSFLTNNETYKKKLTTRLNTIRSSEQILEGHFVYQQILSICKSIIAFKIKEIIQKMTENIYLDYLTIIQTNKSISTDKIIQKFCQNLTIQKMLEIDVLSIFFKKNLELKKRYSQQFKDFILSNKVLANIFRTIESFVKVYLQKYLQVEPILIYDYQKQFQPIRNLIFLNQLKYRLSVSKKIIPQQLRRKVPLSLTIQQTIKFEEEEQQCLNYPFYFRFCQVLYLKKCRKQKKELYQLKSREFLNKMRQIKYEYCQRVKRELLRFISVWGLSVLVFSDFLRKLQGKKDTLKALNDQ